MTLRRRLTFGSSVKLLAESSGHISPEGVEDVRPTVLQKINVIITGHAGRCGKPSSLIHLLQKQNSILTFKHSCR